LNVPARADPIEPAGDARPIHPPPGRGHATGADRYHWHLARNPDVPRMPVQTREQSVEAPMDDAVNRNTVRRTGKCAHP